MSKEPGDKPSEDVIAIARVLVEQNDPIGQNEVFMLAREILRLSAPSTTPQNGETLRRFVPGECPRMTVAAAEGRGIEEGCFLERELAEAKAQLNAGMLLSASPSATLAPHVDGQDFYELCQAYRHASEIAPHPNVPNVVLAFNNLCEYIKTGKLPWPSYENAVDRGDT